MVPQHSFAAVRAMSHGKPKQKKCRHNLGRRLLCRGPLNDSSAIKIASEWRCAILVHSGLELSISKNTPRGRSRQCRPKVPGTFLLPKILEFVAFRDSGNFFQHLSRDFPGVFPEDPRTDPGNSHSLLEFLKVRHEKGTQT